MVGECWIISKIGVKPLDLVPGMILSTVLVKSKIILSTLSELLTIFGFDPVDSMDEAQNHPVDSMMASAVFWQLFVMMPFHEHASSEMR